MAATRRGFLPSAGTRPQRPASQILLCFYSLECEAISVPCHLWGAKQQDSWETVRETAVCFHSSCLSTVNSKLKAEQE